MVNVLFKQTQIDKLIDVRDGNEPRQSFAPNNHLSAETRLQYLVSNVSLSLPCKQTHN